MFVTCPWETNGVNEKLRFGYALAIVLSSGCTPLQQAPLAYTSTQVVGVKLGVAPTQPESVEFVFGFKALDAAYAPVAVAKPELKDALLKGGHISNELYGVHEIYGVYGTQNEGDDVTKLLTDKEAEGVNAYLGAEVAKRKAQDMLQSATTAHTDQVGKVEAIKRLMGGLKSSCSKIKLPSEGELTAEGCKGDQLELGLAIAEYNKLSPEDRKVDELDRDLSAAVKVVNDAQVDFDTASSAAHKIKSDVIGALEKLSSVQKRDAISVYGSFDTDTSTAFGLKKVGGGENNKVSVKIGKVFSTGVAAQNISEAQANFSRAAMLDVCFNSISGLTTALIPDANKTADRTSLSKVYWDSCVERFSNKTNMKGGSN